MPNPRDSLPDALGLIKYAAVWRAVAAADRRAAWARAFDNLVAQSGRILSVVTTVGSVADREVARRRPGTPAVADDKEEVEDKGEVKLGESRAPGSEA